MQDRSIFYTQPGQGTPYSKFQRVDGPAFEIARVDDKGLVGRACDIYADAGFFASYAITVKVPMQTQIASQPLRIEVRESIAYVSAEYFAANHEGNYLFLPLHHHIPQAQMGNRPD
jgi:hypothetical protein